MAELTLSFACEDYFDRTRALIDGTVTPEGCRLEFVRMHPAELFRRVAQGTEFDVAEMSTSTYMNLADRGDDRYIALPVFISRNFRHGYIFVHRDSGIREPKDLRGKRVGVAEYQMTAALWQRAAIQHDYGVHPGEMRWFEGGLFAPGYHERNPIPPPPGVSIERIPDDKWLEQMLADGEIDALFTALRPPALLDGTGRIRRLFPDYAAVEADYYRRTGLFPIMHTIVVRGALYREQRWLAPALVRAFAEAQRVGWRRLVDTGALAVMLPWLTVELERIAEAMGPDPWPYGFEANRTVLAAMCDYHHEQGLSSRRLRPEQLFAPETLDLTLPSPLAGPRG